MTSAADLVVAAWRGEHLPPDGSWQRIAPWNPALYAVLSFTGHAAVSAPESVSDAELSSWGVNDTHLARLSGGRARSGDSRVDLSFGGLSVVSYEIAPGARGEGLGTETVSAARGLVATGEPVAALVSPGNVASLRAALRAGCEPAGSVQLYRP